MKKAVENKQIASAGKVTFHAGIVFDTNLQL